MDEKFKSLLKELGHEELIPMFEKMGVLTLADVFSKLQTDNNFMRETFSDVITDKVELENLTTILRAKGASADVMVLYKWLGIIAVIVVILLFFI